LTSCGVHQPVEHQPATTRRTASSVRGEPTPALVSRCFTASVSSPTAPAPPR
jgi:hypothetical protein